MKIALIPLCVLLLVCPFSMADSDGPGDFTPPPNSLFGSDAVHRVDLTFVETDWLDLLEAHHSAPDTVWLEAEFDWGGVHFDRIGVRTKGSSDNRSVVGNKQSFKLDLNEFVGGQRIDGVDKLHLNNCFKDPSFVREKCAYELARAAGLPTVRTNFVELWVNGERFGLYLLTEQIDGDFIESRFGEREDGNLYRGSPDPSFAYLGPDQASYYDRYELETNTNANDWSGLVAFIDALNNTADVDLAATVEPLVDLHSAIAMLALSNLTVNLETYVGAGGHFFVYQRDLDGRLVFSAWDLTAAWGGYNDWGLTTQEMTELPTDWVTPTTGEARPLFTQLMKVAEFDRLYHGFLRGLMAGPADPDTLVARMNALRTLIRPYVVLDPNKLYTTAEFDAAMTSDTTETRLAPAKTIPALETFVRGRDAWLRGAIGEWTGSGGLVINEVMSENATTIADGMGEYDDWIEIMNVGATPRDLAGLVLTDNLTSLDAYVFPSVVLGPGEKTVVFADNAPAQGPDHAAFGLGSGSDEVYLLDGDVVLDFVTFSSPGTDVSYGRSPDGTGVWRALAVPTPGAANMVPAPSGATVVINELMADNFVTVEEPDSPFAFPDWFELYNPGATAVDLGGMFVTDDLNDPMRYRIPAGTTLAAGAHLVFWADADEEQGPLHTNFKLAASGDELGLFDRDGETLIDAVEFAPQETDRAWARNGDADPLWLTPNAATPGTANERGEYLPFTVKVVTVKINTKKPDKDKAKIVATFPAANIDPTAHGFELRMLGLDFSLPPEAFVLKKTKFVGKGEGPLKSVVLNLKSGKLVINIKKANLGGPLDDEFVRVRIDCGAYDFDETVTTLMKNEGRAAKYKVK